MITASFSKTQHGHGRKDGAISFASRCYHMRMPPPTPTILSALPSEGRKELRLPEHRCCTFSPLTLTKDLKSVLGNVIPLVLAHTVGMPATWLTLPIRTVQVEGAPSTGPQKPPERAQSTLGRYTSLREQTVFSTSESLRSHPLSCLCKQALMGTCCYAQSYLMLFLIKSSC